jgi:hypothetical protein
MSRRPSPALGIPRQALSRLILFEDDHLPCLAFPYASFACYTPVRRNAGNPGCVAFTQTFTQNENRAPNWNARGPPDPNTCPARLVGTPNPAEFTAELIPPRFAMLKMLNPSPNTLTL